jgi:ABC-type molybdate transport system substrate-binding protein
MNSLVFHVDADKIDVTMLDSIKAFYGNRRIQVIVKPEDTVTDLLAKNEAGEHDYKLPYEDIARIADALDRNETIDVMAEVKKFMVEK